MQISVTRKFEFSYAHHLLGYQGACARVHGHNSNVEVEIGMRSGKNIDIPSDGMILDFKTMDAMIWECVIGKLDHQDLNAIGFKFPTAENIALHIYSQIAAELKKKELTQLEVIRVRVSETNDSFAEVKA